MKPLRILSVGHANSPHYAERTAALASLGHEIIELTGHPESLAGGLPLSICGAPFGRFWRLVTLTRILHFLSLRRRLGVDLVFVHYAKGLWAWLAPALGKPVAISVMGGDVLFGEQGDSSLLDRLVTCGLIRSSSLAVCKTPHLAERVRAMNVRGQVGVCSWGVDRTVFRPEAGARLKRTLALSEDALLVFSPRAMQPLYNIHVVVRAFAALARPEPRARLLISTYRADPAYLAQVQAVCAESGVEKQIVFLPPLDRQAMAAHLAAADIVISLPSSDGLPQTFFETTASGTPVIMSDLPHYRERIQDGRHALLVEPSEDATTRGLLRLAEDLKLRQELVREADDLLETLSREEGVENLGKQLRETVAVGRAPGIGAGLRQLALVLCMLAAGKPMAAKTGQPVSGSFTGWLKSLGKAGRSCAA